MSKNVPRRKLRPTEELIHKSGKVTKRVKRDPNKIKNENNLNPRQEIIAATYIERLVAGSKSPVRDAAEAAGISTINTSKSIHSNPDVQQRIDEHVNEVLERMGVTNEFLIRKLFERANFDVRALYNEDGTLKEISELDDVAASAIAGVEIEALYDIPGRDRKRIGETVKYKHWNPLDAIKLLADIKRITGPTRIQFDNPLPVTLTDLDEKLISAFEKLRARKAALGE